MPKGANLTFSVPGYGSRSVVVVRLQHGMRFIAKETGVSRSRKSWYPQVQTSSSFEVDLLFAKYDEYRSFVDWLVEYARRMSNPNGVSIAMNISLPSRRFLKSVVVEQAIALQRTSQDVTWGLHLQFAGVSDPLSYDSPLLSAYKAAKNQDEISKFFYPAGVQLTAEDRALEEARRAVGETVVDGVIITPGEIPWWEQPEFAPGFTG